MRKDLCVFKRINLAVSAERINRLFTFAMLDTAIATHSGAPVTFTITGVAAGTTKFQAKYDSKVFDEATVIVKEHIDEETDDLDDDGIEDIFDDDVDGDGRIDNTPAKWWSPDTGISGGEFGVTEVTVAAGGTVGLEVTQAGDSDKWRQGNDSGHEPDSVHYNWSATGGSVTPDSSEPWKSTFTAPNESGEYYVKVKIDDEPAAVVSPDRGRRDDSAVTRTVKVIVQQKKWDTDLAIGKYRQEDGNVLENGRLIAPQDQRANPATPETVTVAPGKSVNLEVEAATDIDHWEEKYGSNPGEGYDEDEVTYTWSATGGTVTPDPSDPKKATWQAPNDDGDYTVKVTIDDEPKTIPSGEGGTRDDDSVERSVKIKVAPFRIEWEGLARAVAGGVALDGAHDFTITGTAKRDDDTVVANTELKLTFEGNKGHDYSGDPVGIKPEGWTPEQIKRAKFVKAGPPLELVEELAVTTDAEGKFSVHVLGSDIVSNDIKIKVAWKDDDDNEKDVGEKECDFAASVSLRRFGLVNYPDEEDTGWIFNDAALMDVAYSTEIIASSGTTPAKVYLKFQIDPSISRDTNYFNPDGTPRRPLDDDGNWKFVNGHHVIIRIVDITPQEGASFSGAIDDYATLLDANGQPVDEVHALTSSDGAAQVRIKAEILINQAKEVILAVEDVTEQ